MTSNLGQDDDVKSQTAEVEQFFFKNDYWRESFVYFFLGLFLLPFLFGVWKCTHTDTESCIFEMFALSLLLSSPLLAIFLWLPYEEELFIHKDFFVLSSRALLSFKKKKIYFRKIRFITLRKVSFFFRRENPFKLRVTQRENGKLSGIRLYSTHNKKGFQRLCGLINEYLWAKRYMPGVKLKERAPHLFLQSPEKHRAWFERHF